MKATPHAVARTNLHPQLGPCLLDETREGLNCSDTLWLIVYQVRALGRAKPALALVPCH